MTSTKVISVLFEEDIKMIALASQQSLEHYLFSCLFSPCSKRLQTASFYDVQAFVVAVLYYVLGQRPTRLTPK